MDEQTRRIRKDSSELTYEDLSLASIWEYCLDEEGLDDQDECTLRPAEESRGLDSEFMGGIVVVDLTAANGTRLTGMMSMEIGSFQGPWACQLTVVLTCNVGELVDHPLLHSYNVVMDHDGPFVSLALPWPDEKEASETRLLVDLAYQAMGLGPDELFPLAIRPRATILGWPEELQIDGFIRPVERGGEVFRFER